MNLLAHLHVGDRLSPVASAGNLAADLCRNPSCPEYRRGMEFHQKIDTFTDTHPVVLASRKLFPGQLRRFSAVILDLVFDHCLSQSWEKWHHTNSREEFIESRLTQILQVSNQLPTNAAEMIHHMQQSRLLHRYSELEGVAFSIRRIVVRRPKFAPMLEAIPLLESKYQLVNETFQTFYPELLAHTTPPPHHQNEIPQNQIPRKPLQQQCPLTPASHIM
ncbi:ACP phosphodiesterase [[Limnothrix rosea] IAM M-220]|uniref:acyl carrier protein phosphodiesterase n=1 Tax=[Limnothrix rosea] IAM M-220 TaxID=454133 RepID=UPI00095A66AB|nr:ACP phosphodiesterase [[Limnothrix rosea] IAM M-220]OKH18787.1 hypothetical protein NIES208_04855 [[Limnothrix rosea] IAM M-220]